MTTPNEKWNKLLYEGETIQWTGKPENVKLLDTSSRMKSYILWCVAAIWLALSLILYLPRAAATGNSWVQLIVVLIVMDCVPLLMISMPFTDISILNKFTEYAITDQRVLIQGKERAITMPINSQTPVEVRFRGAEGGHVLIGEAVGKPDKKLRAIALSALDHDHVYSGVVLYHIADPEKAVQSIPGRSLRKGQ